MLDLAEIFLFMGLEGVNALGASEDPVAADPPGRRQVLLRWVFAVR